MAMQNRPKVARVITALEFQNTRRGPLNIANSFSILKKTVDQKEVLQSLNFPSAFAQNSRENN